MILVFGLMLISMRSGMAFEDPTKLAGFANAIKTVAWVAGTLVFMGLLASFMLPKNAARVESEGYEPPHQREGSTSGP